jgi:Tfp pilus assembly protein PilV
MRMRNLNNTAFSLLEILLAAVIFIVSVGGIFATLNAVRTPVANKENALAAAVFGKQVLEALRSQVNAATYYAPCGAVNPDNSCGSFSLFLGSHEISTATLNSNGLNWPTLPSGQSLGAAQQTLNVLSYTVSCADGSGSYGSSSPCTNADIARRVDLNIKW